VYQRWRNFVVGRVVIPPFRAPNTAHAKLEAYCV